MPTNPYRVLDDFCFWSRAMTAPAPGQIDPVVDPGLRANRIESSYRIATMGSCFAQHLSRIVEQAGFNYYVPEAAPEGMAAGVARAHGYGVFSARYGNVYTVRQALQLFQRAFGSFHPQETAWARGGRFVDAFRPQIEPAGLASAAEVATEAERHLARVRDVFAHADWLILTLGLTEAWRSKLDGAVYPVAPGVASDSFDPDLHEFVNFTASEVRDDLFALIEAMRKLNPGVRLLLTVSPVPLIATAERRHVWVSTTYSKSALRVAADEAERRFSDVTYFPSYEVITSPAAGGRYYADDLRQVTELGVKHVMRLFRKHFLSQPETAAKPAVEPVAALTPDMEVDCDEEVIERALRKSGF